MLSSENGHGPVVQLLLAHGANADAANTTVRSPFFVFPSLAALSLWLYTARQGCLHGAFSALPALASFPFAPLGALSAHFRESSHGTSLLLLVG